LLQTSCCLKLVEKLINVSVTGNSKPSSTFTQNIWKMIIFPKAKINLGLRITRKRPDGYHDIETLFYPVNLTDALEFVVSPAEINLDTLTLTGLETGSDPQENLVMKTVKKLREKHTFPYLKIHLHKVIPVGAGLGGGSSDAAFILKALNRHFELSMDDDVLKRTALELGSDCPFFIDATAAFASGRGEILKPIGSVLTGYYIVMLNPGVGIITREAFRECHPKNPSISLLKIIERPVSEWKELILNDFEDFAFKKHPLIGEMKKELYNCGAFFSLMSGSGSTVYGLFSERPTIPDKLRNFIIWQGTL
jgi:4-diphosphocytidyl-2-C-methyl-D-erythritol kinase